METEDYRKNAGPYAKVYGAARLVYQMETPDFNEEDFAALTPEQAEDFYNVRARFIKRSMEQRGGSAETLSAVRMLERAVNKPFRLACADGYFMFLTSVYLTGIFTAFLMEICVAPLFAEEYTSGADQLILTSKLGRSQAVWAKIFTGFSLTALLSAAFTAQTYVQCMLGYGCGGAYAPIQLFLPASVYPVTLGKAALLTALCVLCACLLLAAVTMLLSAKLKTPSRAILPPFLVLLIPMLLVLPEKLPVCLLPANMMQYGLLFGVYPYGVGGNALAPYEAAPLFALLCSAALVPFIFRGFKGHPSR